MAYLAQWRLKLGAEILQSTQDSVAEIAAVVGYGSEAAFNRAFKREFNCPPKRAVGTNRIMGIVYPRLVVRHPRHGRRTPIADIWQVEPIPSAYWIGRQTGGTCNLDNSGIFGSVRSIAIEHGGWFPRPQVWTFLIPRRGCINQPRVVRQRTTLGRGRGQSLHP